MKKTQTNKYIEEDNKQLTTKHQDVKWANHTMACNLYVNQFILSDTNLQV